MSSTVISRVKDVITFVLPRFVVECVPLILATVLFQLELVRFCFFQGFQRPTGPQESIDYVASCLPWNVPEDPRSWLGRITLWGCSIVCTVSAVALDVTLIITGHDKDIQPHQEDPRDKEGESVGYQNQFLHGGDGASNISTEREVETTNRPHQRSELGLNSDSRKTEKAVRFFPSPSDVVAAVADVDGEDQLRMVCEHKVEERPGNPEPCWPLAPSLMANNSSRNTERAATAKISPSRASLAIVPPDGPSFAEVAGSRRHSTEGTDQEHTFIADHINHDKTFAQVVASSDDVKSSLPASKDREQSVPHHSQSTETTGVCEEDKQDDLKTFAQAAAEGTVGVRGGEVGNSKVSADGPSLIDPKVTVSFAAAAGDHDEKIETHSGKGWRGEDSSAKTFAEAAAASTVAPTTATEESFESDQETTANTTTTTFMAEDGNRLHCDTSSSPWSPAPNKVEPPSPGLSATGHESDEDHHSEQSDDTSESSERKNKNRGLKKTNRRNKNKKRREKTKKDRVASRCQLDPSVISTDTDSTAPSVVVEDNGAKEEQRLP